MWNDIEEKQMPLETFILVKHKYGIEGIHFFDAKWSYWYSGNIVAIATLKSITHWLNPKEII